MVVNRKLLITLLHYFQICGNEKDKGKLTGTEKRKADDGEPNKDLKKVSYCDGLQLNMDVNNSQQVDY